MTASTIKILVAADPATLPPGVLQAGVDFLYAEAGEVCLLPATLCEGNPEYRQVCGCGRAFTGAASGRRTTLAVVQELSREEALSRIRTGAAYHAWVHGPVLSVSDEEFLQDCFAPYQAALATYSPGEHVRINSSPERFYIYPASNPMEEQL
jgi:hypothetical protein